MRRWPLPWMMVLAGMTQSLPLSRRRQPPALTENALGLWISSQSGESPFSSARKPSLAAMTSLRTRGSWGSLTPTEVEAEMVPKVSVTVSV